MVQLCDTLTLDRSARICRDGSLVAEVFAARTGLQDYMGREVDPENAHGLRDSATVKIYRPESEVFKADSLASFAAAPVTVGHPSVAVDASNWKELGVGEINGDVVRDGQRVRVPIIVRDAGAVTKATTSHKQLSMGYATELVFPTDGKHPDGTTCDAYQTDIKINHIALVPAARGGPELRVVDERPSTQENPMKIKIGDAEVDATNGEAVRIAVDSLNTAMSDAKGQVSTLTGEKAALQGQLDDAKAAIEPAKIDKLVADRAALVTQAKAICADAVTDGKTDAEIRRAVVELKLGDAGKALDDAAIPGAFAVLSAAPNDTKTVVNINPAQAIGDGASAVSSIRAMRYA